MAIYSQQDTNNVIAFAPRSGESAMVSKRSGSVVLPFDARRMSAMVPTVACIDAWYHAEAIEQDPRDTRQ